MKGVGKLDGFRFGEMWVENLFRIFRGGFRVIVYFMERGGSEFRR